MILPRRVGATADGELDSSVLGRASNCDEGMTFCHLFSNALKDVSRKQKRQRRLKMRPRQHERDHVSGCKYLTSRPVCGCRHCPLRSAVEDGSRAQRSVFVMLRILGKRQVMAKLLLPNLAVFG